MITFYNKTILTIVVVVNRQAWDTCREVPVIQDEINPPKRLCFMKWFCCSLVGTLVFTLTVLSKVSCVVHHEKTYIYRIVQKCHAHVK